MEARIKQALAYLSDYIFNNRYGTNWSLVVDISGYNVDWEDHPRLTRAQYFHDDDYPDAIYRFLKEVYDTDLEAFKKMVAYIFNEKLPDDPRLKNVLANLGVINIEASNFPISLTLSIPMRFIDVDTFPDDFYRDLIHLINIAYQTEIYPVVPILIRKLLENLLVDILRSHYGMRDVSIFYDVNHGSFHSFSTLIDNARQKLEDFNWCSDLFNADLLRQIDKYREQGNASAHSIVMRVRREDLEKNKDEIIQTVRQLLKTFSLINTASRSH